MDPTLFACLDKRTSVGLPLKDSLLKELRREAELKMAKLLL